MSHSQDYGVTVRLSFHPQKQVSPLMVQLNTSHNNWKSIWKTTFPCFPLFNALTCKNYYGKGGSRQFLCHLLLWFCISMTMPQHEWLQCRNNQVKQCWTPWTESVLLPETLTLQDYIPFLFKIILIKATSQSWWEWVGASRPCLSVYSWFSATISGVWCWPFLCNFSRLITIETLEHEEHEEHAPLLSCSCLQILLIFFCVKSNKLLWFSKLISFGSGSLLFIISKLNEIISTGIIHQPFLI